MSMRIMKRKEAVELELKTYFTGVVCRNGHLAVRYTSSGTCSGCVKDSNSSIYTPEQIDRKEAFKDLHRTLLRVDVSQFLTMSNAAWAAAFVRFPYLEHTDICPRPHPVKPFSGTAIYVFYVHPDDLASLKKLANDLCATDFDINAVRADIASRIGSFMEPVAMLPKLHPDQKT